MASVELSMTKDKAGKSPQRRRKPGNPDSVVFSSNRSVLDWYTKCGTSIAPPDEPDPTVFKELLKKLTQQKEARYEQ
jgi:hypothetical protein